MMKLRFDALKRVLCLGAHSDDIEIGAGGTILEYLARDPDVHVDWVVFAAADPVRAEEARESARRFLKQAKSAKVHIFDFRDGFFPSDRIRLKEQFESLKAEIHPDLILTHHHDDAHQDHRMVNELTWNTWRNHLVLEYEIVKWDGDLGRPNVYVPISAERLDEKISTLVDAFSSQRGKDWFDQETFRGLGRIRGMECRSESNYAEAFHARKLVI